jgi:hypothetical protein
MPSTDDLLKDQPNRWTRGYIQSILTELKPERIVIPCLGAFSLYSTVIDSGAKPSQVVGCEPSLYSTVIGALLSGQPLSVVPTGDLEWLAPHMQDPSGVVAGVLLGQRILSCSGDQAYNRQRRDELIRRFDVYLARLRSAADQWLERLGGLDFRLITDPRDLLEEVKDDPGTLILLDPHPASHRKETTEFDDVFIWDKPTSDPITDGDLHYLMPNLGQASAAVIVAYTPMRSGVDPAQTFGPPWYSVFAHRPTTGVEARIDWLVANRCLPKSLVRLDVPPSRVQHRPIFLEGEVCASTSLDVALVNEEEANYYRDLFVHRLPMIKTRRYMLLLIDGYVAGVLGWQLADAYKSDGPGLAQLTFGFTVPNKRHPRLHKLTLMCAISSWLTDTLTPMSMGDLAPSLTRIHTTMHARYPEVKTARGVLNLLQRNPEPDGTYKLQYGSPIISRNRQETLDLWLEMESKGSARTK